MGAVVASEVFEEFLFGSVVGPLSFLKELKSVVVMARPMLRGVATEKFIGSFAAEGDADVFLHVVGETVDEDVRGSCQW